MKETRRIQLSTEDFSALLRSNYRLETAAMFRAREAVERELATLKFNERWEKRRKDAEETVRQAVDAQKALADRLSKKYGIDFSSIDTRFDDETGIVSIATSANNSADGSGDGSDGSPSGGGN